MRREKRRAALKRRTRGTEVEIELRLDGSGRTAIDTPFQPLNELLTLMAAHSGLDLRLVQLANRHADDPYALDDLATGLAEGFRRAVGLRPRVRQFASAIVPVGDALVLAAIDLVSPPVFLFGATFDGRRSGDMDPALIERFLATFLDRLGASLHLRVLAGAHEENRMRAVFIALGRCLSEACLEMERDGAREVALDLDYSEGVRRPPSGDEALDEAVIEELVPASEIEDEPAARVADEALPRERRAGRERGRGREGRESGEGREGRERGRPERGRRRELPSRTAPAAEAELELPGMHLEPAVEEFGELADLPDLADYPDLQPREEAIPERGAAEFDEGDLEGRSESRRRRRGRRGGRGRRRAEPEPATAEPGVGDAIGGEARERAAEPKGLSSPYDQEGGEEEEAFVPAYPRGRSAGRDAGRPGRGEPRGDRMRRERGRPDRGTDELPQDELPQDELPQDELPQDVVAGHERDRDARGRDRQEAHDADESFTPGPIDGEEPARGRDSRRRSTDLRSQSSFGRGRKSALALRPAPAEEPVEKLEPATPFPADAESDEEEIAPFRPGARSRSPQETAEPIPAGETDGVLDFISRPKESPAPEGPRAMARTRRRRR